MLSKKHPSYVYAKAVAEGSINAPRYVKLQCQEFLLIANDKLAKYRIDDVLVDKIDRLLNLLIMAKGLQAGQSVKNALAGLQYCVLFIGIILKNVDMKTVCLKSAERMVKRLSLPFFFCCCSFWSLGSRNFTPSHLMAACHVR